jgi:hypothetical protein
MSELPSIFINGSIRQMTEEEHAAHLVNLAAISQPKPVLVSMRQMRIAIIDRKKVTAVSDAIKAIPDATEKAKVQVEWDYNTVVERDAPWFLTIMSGIGYEEADIDALFLEAAAL